MSLILLAIIPKTPWCQLFPKTKIKFELLWFAAWLFASSKIWLSINFLFSFNKNSFLLIDSICSISFDINNFEAREESSILLAALIWGPTTKPKSWEVGDETIFELSIN